MATKVKLVADGVITPDQITLTTASTGTNTTAPATTAFVQQEISALVDSSPDALNTLNELAAALGDDENFSTTVTNSIATKLPLAGGTLTGTLNINNSSGFGNIELGGSSGGYVDFKTPFSDDYDARIIYPGGYLQISTSNDEPILLKHNESEKLRTTSTGIDITGNATFDDDGKAMFGAGFDLQIYHNGSNSFIDEAGTGILYIRAATDLRLTNRDSSKTYANFEDGGASKLYHDNALSIFTTTSGGEVREALTIGSSNNDLGTTAGDQLTPLTLRSDTSNADFLLFTTERLSNGTNWTTAAHRIQRKVDATKMGYIQFGSNSTDLITFGESETERMRIDGSGNVGIGTSNPKTTLNLAANNSGQGAILTLENTDTSITSNDVIGQIDFYANDGSNNGTGAKVNIKGIATSTAGTITALTFGTADSASSTGVERMRIDGSGNVQIGTSNPSGNKAITIQAGTDSSASLRLKNDAHDWDVNCQTNDNFAIYSQTDTTERLIINPSTEITLKPNNGTVIVDGGTADYEPAKVELQGRAFGGDITAKYEVSDGGAVFFGSTTNHSVRFIANNTEKFRIESSQILLNGGTQTYSNNQRLQSGSESITWASSTSAQSWTSSNYLPYQKFVEAALHFGYSGNGAISQHFYISLMNHFTGLSIQTLHSASGNSGSSYHTISFTSTGAYNTRRLVVQNTPAGGQNTANLNGTIYYGFAR